MLVLTKCPSASVSLVGKHVVLWYYHISILHRLSFGQTGRGAPYLHFVPHPKQPCCCINYFICPPFSLRAASYSPLIPSSLPYLRLFQREKASSGSPGTKEPILSSSLSNNPLCPSYLIPVKTNRKPSICLFVCG